MRRFIEAAKALENCPLFIDDTPALPISTIAARARRLKRQHGLDVLVIDYLQLARPASSRSEGRVQEVSEITQGLKAIAKELNIPVIALSQLSAPVESREDKRPQLSDLRESGSIEQDADVVMFVFREEYYKEREKPGDHDIEAMVKWKDAMSRPARQGRGHHRQAAPRPDRHGRPRLRGRVHPLLQPRAARTSRGARSTSGEAGHERRGQGAIHGVAFGPEAAAGRGQWICLPNRRWRAGEAGAPRR